MTSELGWVRRGRVPCLDGIRAISILLVVMEHSRQSIRPAALKSVLWLFNGHFGVTCFFVISGFLISLLLFRELERTQTISLTGFYTRRALRLLPAYAAYLVFVLIVTQITNRPITWPYWTGALTYTLCYIPRHSAWLMGHLWSLAVEEHFYLFWPILVVWLRPRRATVVAFVYVMLTPAIRYLMWRQHRDWLDIDFASLTQMNGIAVGCILAFVVFNYDVQLIQLLSARRAIALTAASFIGLIASSILDHSGKYHIFLSDPVASVLVAACVLGIWHNPDGYIHRWLNIRWVIAIGILSYSIYLWQQPFSDSTAIHWWDRWPLKLVFVLAAATASYFLIERPFLQLKTRVSSRNRVAEPETPFSPA